MCEPCGPLQALIEQWRGGDHLTQLLAQEKILHHVLAESTGPASPAPLKAVVAAWNALGPPFSEILGLGRGGTRERQLRARLKEPFFRDNWPEIIRQVDRIPLCRGEIKSTDGRRPWVTSFDWLIKSSDNGRKVLEWAQRELAGMRDE